MKTLIAIAAAGAALGAASASAQEMRVRIMPGELDSRAGIERVYDRITSAAGRVCEVRSRKPLYKKRDDRACVAEMTADVVAKVGDSGLNARYAADFGAARLARR